MDSRLRNILTATLVSLVIAPILVLVFGGGLGIAVMGEIIVIDVFIVISVMVFGLAE